jgi:hypothetical protein
MRVRERQQCRIFGGAATKAEVGARDEEAHRALLERGRNASTTTPQRYSKASGSIGSFTRTSSKSMRMKRSEEPSGSSR